MAVTGNPGRAQKFTAAADVRTGRVFINTIGVLDFAAAEDAAVITDSNGNEIISFSAVVAHDSPSQILNEWYDGIIIATLDSGTVEITYR